MNPVNTFAGVAMSAVLALAGAYAVPVSTQAAAATSSKLTVTYTHFKWAKAADWKMSADELSAMKALADGTAGAKTPDFGVRFGTATVTAKGRGSYSYGTEKNKPAVTIRLGASTVHATCDDLHLTDAKPVTSKPSKHDVRCHLAFSSTELKSFVTALLALPDLGTIRYTFKTPKLAGHGKGWDEGRDKATVVSYKGISRFSNKSVTSIETIHKP